ncbi:MAG: hypothetical protein KF850_18610 [Labilithrix sp.]|nr:hypothetical protein [Labilithrix sp.]
MSYLRRLTAVVASGLAVAGCFSWGAGDGGCAPAGNGLTGAGTFTYVCTSSADPECDDRLTIDATQPLPQAIARGGRFGLLYSGGAVTPVSSKAARVTDTGFVALRSGSVGFVVLAGTEAVDAVRLEVVEADGIAIGSLGAALGSGRFGDAERLVLGRPFTLRVAALQGGQPLAGTLSDVTWTVDPPELATAFVGVGTCELTAKTPGSGRVIAARDGLVAELRVRVEEAPDPGDAGDDSSASDASDDADASDDVAPPDASDDGGDP